MKTSSRLRPIAVIILSSSLPALPTKGRPWASSSPPGASPTKTILAFALPFIAGEYILPVARKPLPLRIAAIATLAGSLLLLPNLVVAAGLIAGVAFALDAGESRGLFRPWVRMSVLGVMLGVIAVSAGLGSVHEGFAFYRKDAGKYRPSARTARWQAVLIAAQERPLLGFGPGRFQDRIGQYYYHGITKPEGYTDDVAGYDIRADEPGTQNHWEVSLAETGLFGVAAWLLVLAGGFVMAMRHGRPAVAGSLLAVAVAGLSVVVWARAVGVLWAYMLALSERNRPPAKPADTS